MIINCTPLSGTNTQFFTNQCILFLFVFKQRLIYTDASGAHVTFFGPTSDISCSTGGSSSTPCAACQHAIRSSDCVAFFTLCPGLLYLEDLAWPVHECFFNFPRSILQPFGQVGMDTCSSLASFRLKILHHSIGFVDIWVERRSLPTLASQYNLSLTFLALLFPFSHSY